VRRFARAPAHILIACMAKSGSTFLSDIIAELPGFRRAMLVPAYGRRAQELDEVCLQAFDRDDYVAQNHVPYSDHTAELCGDYGLAPVVLVRDLLDVVVSLRDHLRRQGPVSPIFFAEREHARLDDARLAMMLVRLALPWYLNFYLTWRNAPDALLISYEDLAAAPAATVSRILAFAGAAVDPGEVRAAVARVERAGASRFNVGVAGRGAELPPEAVRGVLELIDYYPEAAGDPYLASVRRRCEAVLAGSIPSEAGAAALLAQPARSPLGPRVLLARWWRRNAARLVMRALAPLALASGAIAYWLWRDDLIPDGARFGALDDALLLLAAGLIAGRLTLHKPRRPPLRPGRRGWVDQR
jgi:hypothetical protein